MHTFVSMIQESNFIISTLITNNMKALRIVNYFETVIILFSGNMIILNIILIVLR